MTIRQVPWLPWAVGLVFVAAGAAVALFVTALVRVHCSRDDGLCTVERSTLLVTTGTTSWPADETTGAELEQLSDEEGMSYRVVVLTRHGPEPLTSYSMGLGREKKKAMVAAIRDYAADPQARTLDTAQDERVPFFAVAIGATLFGLLPFLSQGVSVLELDAGRHRLSLHRRSRPGRGDMEVSLAEVVEATDEPGTTPATASTYRVVLRMRSGERVPFTHYRYPGKARTTIVVEAINAFLDRTGRPGRPDQAAPAGGAQEYRLPGGR